MNTVASASFNKLAPLKETKIVTLKEISDVLDAFRVNKTIIQCHGVFDLLHIGHIKHLQQAKNYGDILVVTVTADQFVNKGVDRPYFTDRLRAEALAALSSVDYVIINHHPTAIEAIQVIKPNYYVKGIEYQNSESDFTGKINDEECAVIATGGELKFTDDVVFSSSHLLNRFFSNYSDEVTTYLNQFKLKYSFNDIVSYMQKTQKLKVLLIGETIIDIYHYGEAIGKSGKEPVLATKYYRTEKYKGGILAIANHIKSFCDTITCITMLGEKGEHEEFIKSNISDNIKLVITHKKDAQTIVKHRYLDEASSHKLFEVYEMNDNHLTNDQRHALCNTIQQHIANHDIVIVADYGHGFLEEESIATIIANAKFLAVNTQANASNLGFNCISKYQRADYVCLAHKELQLNYRQKSTNALQQIKRLMQEYNYTNVVITHGLKPTISCKQSEEPCETPVFTSQVKDRVGAGDAVFAITSLLASLNTPAEIIGFIANAVGAEAVTIQGNKSYIEKNTLLKHIAHMIK